MISFISKKINSLIYSFKIWNSLREFQNSSIFSPWTKLEESHQPITPSFSWSQHICMCVCVSLLCARAFWMLMPKIQQQGKKSHLTGRKDQRGKIKAKTYDKIRVPSKRLPWYMGFTKSRPQGGEEKSDINTQRQRRGKLNMFLKNDLSSEEEKKTVMMRRLVLVAKGFSSPIS